MNQHLFDNETPVSEQEVNEWLGNVPNLSNLPSRREACRKAYNVDEKIRAAKRSPIKHNLKQKNKS